MPKRYVNVARLLVLLAARRIIVGSQSPFDTHDGHKLRKFVGIFYYPRKIYNLLIKNVSDSGWILQKIYILLLYFKYI